MKSPLLIGTSGELNLVVETKHAIDFATDGMPAVLSTPVLIGLLERTARHALHPFLEPEERTVGLKSNRAISPPLPSDNRSPAPCGSFTLRARISPSSSRRGTVTN